MTLILRMFLALTAIVATMWKTAWGGTYLHRGTVGVGDNALRELANTHRRGLDSQMHQAERELHLRRTYAGINRPWARAMIGGGRGIMKAMLAEIRNAGARLHSALVSMTLIRQRDLAATG